MRFLLTVHKITATDLKQLDALCNRYLQKWAGVPRGATNLIFHRSQSMNIQRIASLYEETHYLNHTAIRLKGDIKVNKAFENAVDKESKQSRKKYIQNSTQGFLSGLCPLDFVTLRLAPLDSEMG